MTHYAQNTRTERMRREYASLLRRISDANRPLVADMAQRMENKRLKPGSIRAFVNACHKADQALNGAAFQAVMNDGQALAGMMTVLGKTTSDRYAATISVHLRKLFARLHGIRRPVDLPLDVYDALYVREPARRVVGYVIPDEDFEAMLHAAAGYDGETSTLHRSPMLVAFLWCLRDCGWRLSEALSLNLGDVDVSDGKGARFVLREDAPNLKTGARSVYGARCATAIKNWMALHPRAGDAAAPLFLGLHDRTGLARLGDQRAWIVVKRLAEESGANSKVPTGDGISPHDFRHTRCTEWFRNREGSEEQARGYFGWAPGSKMPSIYTHLTLGDQKEAVLRAAAASPLGTRLPTVEVGVSADDLALLKKLKKLLAD